MKTGGAEHQQGRSWNGTDEDLSRASLASDERAKLIVPASMLPYINHSHFVDLKADVYDAHVVGVDFSRSSVALQRTDYPLQGDITFRLIGPYWDRRMAIRFEGVVAYDAPRASHLGIGDLYWLEFLPYVAPVEDEGDSIHSSDQPAHLCRIHMLPYRQRYDVVFRAIQFGVFPNESRTDEDFALAPDWHLEQPQDPMK